MARKKVKSLLESKTFWIAVIQGVGGILVVALTELDLVGYAALAKSVLDVFVRIDTKEPVK